MFGWSLNLFRIRGIQLALHWTFPLLLAYWGYDGYKDGGVPGMYWNVVLVLAFFTCVVLHELGHSFTAQRFGVGIRRILLTPLGGQAEFDTIPRQWKQEFLITIAGPAVNVLIVAVLWCFVSFPSGWAGDQEPSSLAEFGRVLLVWNGVMCLFNLVPVFPMDGGRILRSILVGIGVPYVRATFWAATVGKVLAVGGIVLAVFYWHAPFVAAIFVYIFMIGDREYRAVKLRDQMEAQWRATLEHLHAAGRPLDEPPLLDH